MIIFSDKEHFKNLYANDTGFFLHVDVSMMLSINTQTNHHFTSIMVEHFMNSARVCWIIRRTVFNLYVCLTTVGEMNATNLKSVMKNQDIKDSFFKI